MLHVHRAERADALVAALGDLLAEPLPDPFAAEVVAVPTRGVERWLAQQLGGRLGAGDGRGDGVCANVAFPPHARLVRDAVAAASGVPPEEDRWRPERSVWALLEVVDAALGEPWLAALARHLDAGGPPGGEQRLRRRLGALRHLAELFDRYALLRPELLAAWGRGDDLDAAGRALPAHAAWQAELWRRLRARIGQPGPAERLIEAAARLRSGDAVVDLPARLAVFGLTRLPAGHLQVLRALAVRRDVHLLLLHPSPALWARIAAELPAHAHAPVVRRDADPTAHHARHRLLASWGDDARELQLVLAPAGEPVADHHHAAAPDPPGTLLARLQAGVRDDEPPPGAPLPGRPDTRPLLAPDDRSVQVHACHGRARQVEVLRDAILHLLDADPSLEPRDVIVMCPDVEAFAPVVHATFGAAADDEDDDLGAGAAGDPPPDLRVRLADRSLRQTNPVLGVVAELLELADARVTASQVLDLADREPVRRRFGLGDDELARLEEWVAATGIRWGLDGEHRRPFGLHHFENGTWRRGLDRVLLGVTMTETDHRRFGGVLPLDDVDGGAADLAGRFAELVDRLEDTLGALAGPQPLTAWVAAVARAADLLVATAPGDAWQEAELARLLGDVLGDADGAGASDAVPLTLAEVRGLLADRLRGRPTRAGFRTGHLTVCTLVPMRSVPHRVVCLLGLDDAAFPRRAVRDGDDLVAAEPHVGDRDPRAEDRQLLLDALLAAGDHLVVTYTGADERTNEPRPPAVPVGELLDVVDRTVRRDEGEARAAVVVRHPLQPFDERNFARGALAPGRHWSHDAAALAGARALAGPRTEPGPLLADPLPPLTDPVLEVDELVRFVERPARAFLRRRLGISVATSDDEPDDALPIELDPLERWDVGQRLLEALLAGADRREACLAEIARGTLPPSELGRGVIHDLLPGVEAIALRAQEAPEHGLEPETVDVRVPLGDGRRLTGTVAGVRGDLVLSAAYSRVSPRHRLAAWVRLLALSATHPDRPFRAVTVGRGRTKRWETTVARLPPLADRPAARRALALEHLATLVDLHDRGMREPSPLRCLTSAAWAQAVAEGKDPAGAACGTWESGFQPTGEDAQPEHERLFGREVPFAALLAVPPRADEHGGPWDDAEPSRFGRYAQRLWSPVLGHEELDDR